jgi:hypothetical protein
MAARGGGGRNRKSPGLGGGGGGGAQGGVGGAALVDDDADVIIVDDASDIDPAKAVHAIGTRAAEDLACSVCSGTMHRAVLHVDCGASFCEGCVTQLTQRALQSRTPVCPLCRKDGRVFVPNLALRHVVATLEANVPALRRGWPEKARLDQVVQLAKDAA